MAAIKAQMTALGSEPKTCTRTFIRGEMMYGIEYENGEPGGWHTEECVEHWRHTGLALCADQLTM